MNLDNKPCRDTIPELLRAVATMLEEGKLVTDKPKFAKNTWIRLAESESDQQELVVMIGDEKFVRKLAAHYREATK